MDDAPNSANKIPESDMTLGGNATSSSAGSIGPYRLLQKLGEGGMGEVWLAEQTTPIHRTVAVKLIKAGMDTGAVVARFESERQALALMDHPNIAKVFDADTTPDGRPYFVMEYVSGISITAYCDKYRLAVRERLEMFIQVCEGVQHAHQKAILHRDLKPSNILVVVQDDKAVPKIIDFGLAKATGQRLTEKTMFTELGVMVGTPGYMSPEQAELSERNVDTRTDVYSLGILLYELLVGALPFDPKELRAAGFEGMLRKIREEDPQRPSTKIRMLGEESKILAEKRKEQPESLARRLRGDLDWITMKALEKDRARRYGTPAELAADISRHLHNEPVLAHATSTAYRFKKYVLRHRIGVTVATGLVLLIVGFAFMQALQLQRITRERDRATRERDRANRITDFMTGMFKVSDPSETRGNSITTREILDKASKDIGTGLARDPELQAQMMHVMGTVYSSLGLYARAELLLKQAIEVQQRVLSLEHPDTLRSMNALAETLSNEGRYAEAEKLYRETFDIQRRVLGPEHADTLGSMAGVAYSVELEGRYGEAEKLQRETLDIRRRVLGPEHSDTLRSTNELGWTLQREGRYPEAEKLYRETFDIRRRVLGPKHPDTLGSMYSLAWTLQQEGRYPEAEKLYRETLDIQRVVLGPEHPDTLASMTSLSWTLSTEGRHADAEKLQHETLDVQERVLGPESPVTLETMETLAATLSDMGRLAEAEKLFRKTRDIQRRVLGPENPYTAISTYNLAGIAAKRRHSDGALSLLREAVDHGLPPAAEMDMEESSDFKWLHGDPRFEALISYARQRTSSGPK